MKKKNKTKTLVNEVVDVNGSKVYIENGDVKTILSEEIQKSGYMSVEDAIDLIKAEVKMIYALNNQRQ